MKRAICFSKVVGSHPPHPFSYVTVAPSGNDAIQPFFGLLKINKKKKTIVASNNVALWSKFYDESVCRNVIIPDAILLLQNEIFKDKKQNSNGIWTTLTITSFFLVFCLIPFVTIPHSLRHYRLKFMFSRLLADCESAG